MHYSLWFGDNLLRDVEVVMNAMGKKRNTVIREAVEKYVDEWRRGGWSEILHNILPSFYSSGRLSGKISFF